METGREPSSRSYRAGYLVVAVGMLGLLMTGCGGSSGNSTRSSSSTQALKRVDVHVVRSATAEAPRRSVLAGIADLLGWPQVAEASSGIPGCTVSASGVPSVLTDA